MATIYQHPAAVPPIPAVVQILARYDRAQLAGFIEVAVGLLDVIDGDVEAEPGTWPEVHSLRVGDPGLHEDAEDDDPGGGNVLDEPHDPEDAVI
jgi:hypothetical protein